MQTGNQIMDILEDNNDVFPIYYMYVEDRFEKITLCVMNLNDIDSNTYEKLRDYCNENVDFTTESYSKITDKKKYISINIS